LENCFDLIRPAVQQVAEEGIAMQIIGGIGAAASRCSLAEFDSGSNTISSPGLFLPQIRDNGSMRDVDVLTLSRNQETIQAVKNIFEETINNAGKKLEVHVFGLKSEEEIRKMQDKPFSTSALIQVVSDRYIIGQEDDKKGYYKAVFPFGVLAPSDSLETWYVDDKKNGAVFPVSHPARTVTDNLTRSIAGVRHKYDEIIPGIVDNMLNKDPELINWMLDGPGSGMIALAGVLRTLGWKKFRNEVRPIILSNVKDIKIIPPNFQTLIDDPSFLLREASEDVKYWALRVSRLKTAYLFGPAERHVQDIWERYNLERFFGKIVGNNI